MDPCSQGLLGASLACSFAKNKKLKFAALCGLIGGITPDLDIFIKSESDSLLSIEYHRHFTHSLFFVPFGGLLVSMIIYLFYKKEPFKKTYLFCTLGFLTHGLLDACTSYGTKLFWPFLELRVSWNLISIIDPIFSSMLLIFIISSIFLKSTKFIRFGTVLSITYLLFCFSQQKKVELFVQNLVEERNHKIDKSFLNPTIGNNILWRSVYKFNNLYFVDAIYMPLFGTPKYKNGVKLEAINKETIFPELSYNSKQRNDIRRFSFFSQDFIFLHPDYENTIADLRYGTLPYDYKSLWGIEIDINNPDSHVKFKSLRRFNSSVYKEFWSMLNGNFH